MKSFFAIVFLLLYATFSLAQEKDSIPVILRSTKSYLIGDYKEQDSSFVKEKCRQAGLDLGHVVKANRIPTDSKLVAPIPSDHLLKQGSLVLQLPMDEKQDEFAVYRSELFDQPAYINVLQIGDELITYRTTEKSGDIQLLYGCIRGAFGTKKYAHPAETTVYKLWDTPERTLLPDYELQTQMAQTEAKKLAKTDYTLLIFNDLKSYAYLGQGDTAIVHVLDTMQKYNPGKLLQADLLTPNSKHYLSRVNENQLWNESMRTKIIETLTEKQTFYSENKMPWMIGNFQILLADKNRKATTMVELEWFLSKAAAFDAGFGLLFDAETMKKHGLTDEMLNAINLWETMRLNGAFSEEQKEMMKDPYLNWHIEKRNDSTTFLFEQQVSRQYMADPIDYENQDDHSGNIRGDWNWKSLYNSPLQLIVSVEGIGSINDLSLITEWGRIDFPDTIKSGQYLIYDGQFRITDSNYNTLEDIHFAHAPMRLLEGDNQVTFSCSYTGEGKKIPRVTLRYTTRGLPKKW